MKTIRVFLLFFIVGALGYRGYNYFVKPIFPKQDIIKGESKKTETETVTDWIEFVKTNSILQIPEDERTKAVILSYLEAHRPIKGRRIPVSDLVRFSQWPAFDGEVAKLVISFEPRVMFYLQDKDRSSEVVNLFQQAVATDKSIFEDYWYSIHFRPNWSPSFVSLVLRLNPSVVVDLPDEIVTAKIIQNLITSKVIKDIQDRKLAGWSAWNENLANQAWELDHDLYMVIPDKYKTLEMTRIMLALNPLMIEDVPLRLRYPHLFSDTEK